jgi:hypothetical protein
VMKDGEDKNKAELYKTSTAYTGFQLLIFLLFHNGLWFRPPENTAPTTVFMIC